MTRARLFFLAAGPALGLYTVTLAPTVSGEDSGELITAAYTLGIAHPPGYPLWCLLGKAFAAIPLGSVAWRVNLLSAVLGAAAVGVLALVAYRLSRSFAAALVAALAFAATRDFWSQAVVAEVYTLNVLVFVLLLELVLRFDETLRARWLYVAAFVLGLGFTNHSTIAPLAPVFALWTFLRLRGKRLPAPDASGRLERAKEKRPVLRPLTLINLTIALLLGFSIVLYLPMRSAADPFMDWGDPESLAATWAHLLRRQYGPEGESVARTVAHQLHLAGLFARSYLAQFFLPTGLLALVGLALEVRRDRGRALLLLALFAMTSYGFIFLLNYPGDREHLHLTRVFFLPAYAVATVWIAVALAALAGALQRALPALLSRTVLATIASAMVALPLLAHYRENDESTNHVAEDWGRNLFRSLEEDAIVFPSADHSTFPLIYLHVVEGVRADVLIGDRYGYVEDRIFEEVFGVEGYPPAAPPLGKSSAEKIRYLIQHSDRPVYLSIKSRGSLPSGYDLLPRGLLYKVVPEREEAHVEESDALWASFRFHESTVRRTPGSFTDDLVLADYHYARGRHALVAGRTDDALAALREAARFGAGIKEVLNNLGGTLAEAEEPAAAREFLEEALRLDPRYELALKNYAGVLFALELYRDGLPWFERVAELEPRNITATLGRARAYRALERKHSALAAYRLALAHDPYNGAIREEAREFAREAFGEGARELALLAAPRPAPEPSGAALELAHPHGDLESLRTPAHRGHDTIPPAWNSSPHGPQPLASHSAPRAFPE